MTQNIPVIVLTGGPCAGKTKALGYLEEKLHDIGFTVFVVGEAVTELKTSGITTHDGRFSLRNFQEAVLTYQIFREEFFKKSAAHSKGKKKVVICDRGIMDIAAYIDEETFGLLLVDMRGISVIEAREGRYNAVIHLRSLASDNEALYQELWKTNPARTENPEQAREKDKKTHDAWLSHPHLRIIDNRGTLEDKLGRLLKEVCHVLGVPVPFEIERKFLVRKPAGVKSWPVSSRSVEIEQAYLYPPEKDVEERVRRRTQDGKSVYYRTHKRNVRPGVRAETEWYISLHEYYRELAYRDTSFAIIRKTRRCFTWDQQYFELDTFIEPRSDLAILEIELTEEHDSVLIPPFIEVIEEVTNNPQFKNREIARIRI